MNRALLNPFEASDLPKGIEAILEQEKATCMLFNRHGNILAVGTSTGRVVVWDFETRSIATTLVEPTDAMISITCIAFPAPHNGSTVLVGYKHCETNLGKVANFGKVRVFDTLSASIMCEVQFQTPILQVAAHPKSPELAIVIPKNSHPLFLHLRCGIYNAPTALFCNVQNPARCVPIPASENQRNLPESLGPRNMPCRPKNAFGNKKIPSLPNRASCTHISVLCTPEEFSSSGASIESNASRRKSPYCVAFTRDGKNILRGGQTGLIRTFLQTDVNPEISPIPKVVCKSVVAIQGKAAIRFIKLSRREDKVLINSQDRSMRLFSLSQLTNGVLNEKQKPRFIEPQTTFTEIVNKLQCQSACFSRDGDFVLGGMEGADHRIHVWRTADGFLDLTLEGPREGIVEILWHPLRPVIASLGSGAGGVYVWMKNFTENWSAFAAEFSELEANEEYQEAEDEFDLKDPEDEEKRQEEREKAESGVIDVETCDGGGWFSSDSDEDDTFFFVPAVPQADSKTEHASLADNIIREKVVEGLRKDSDIEETEVDGQQVREEVGGVGRRKRGRGVEGRDGRWSKAKRMRNGAKRVSGESSGEKGRKGTANGIAHGTANGTANVPGEKLSGAIEDSESNGLQKKVEERELEKGERMECREGSKNGEVVDEVIDGGGASGYATEVG